MSRIDQSFVQQPYILALYDKDDKFVDSVALPYVQSVTKTRPEATDFVWTIEKNALPFRYHSGIRQQNIVLRGFSGVRLSQEMVRWLHDFFGKDVFKHVDNLIAQYQELGKKAAGSSRRNPKLVLVMGWEGEQWIVDDAAFGWARAAKSPSTFGYNWELHLRAYAEYTGKVTFVAGPAVSSMFEDGSLHRNFVRVQETLASEDEELDLFETFDRFADSLQNILRKVTQTLAVPLRYIEKFRQAVSRAMNLVAQVQDILLMPARIIREAIAAISDVLNLFRTILETAKIAVYSTWTALRDAYLFVLSLDDFFVSLYGAIKKWGPNIFPIPETTTISPDIETGTVTDALILEENTADKYIPVLAETDDTLETIAEKYLGDSSQWTVLAQINGGWLSPTIKPDGTLIQAGDTVYVPADASNVDSVLLSTDLKVDNEFDLTLTDDKTDVVLTTGVDALTQAIRIRLTTERGTSKVFPGFGLSVPIGSASSPTTKAMLIADVMAQLNRDPRVSSVQRLEVADQGNLYVLTGEAVVQPEKSIELSIPLGTTNAV